MNKSCTMPLFHQTRRSYMNHTVRSCSCFVGPNVSSASEMTYIVSSGALNSIHSLTPNFSKIGRTTNLLV